MLFLDSEALSYADVSLCPRCSNLASSSEADIRFPYCFRGEEQRELQRIPIINAPMDTVCTPEMISFLYNINMPVTIDRFSFRKPQDQVEFLHSLGIDDFSTVFMAVGTIGKWKEWIDFLLLENNRKKDDCCRFSFLVDVANGDSSTCVDTVRYIIDNSLVRPNVMAGNVATRSAFKRLSEAGANFIRVGIGGGSSCTTRLQTGFGIPVLHSILACREIKREGVYLVADGGIEYTGDICKAMVAGADMVMTGKILAATSLASGPRYNDDLGVEDNLSMVKWAQYRGMASKEARRKLTQSSGSIEGVQGIIPYTGTTREVVGGILSNLKTALSYYAGCTSWYDFQRDVKMVRVSNNTLAESKTRVVQ